MSVRVQEQPAYVCVGGIIIDDIVLPDGETRMAVLGGGATHAAAGMLIWGQRAGLVACAGFDLPKAARQRLERDFDLRGVSWLDIPQARAWQLFEWDGRRTEIPRVEIMDPFLAGALPDQVPAAYQAARGVHLLSNAASLPDWRAQFPEAILLWEPIQTFMTPTNSAAFRAALPQIDIVSPNWLEARQVYGHNSPEKLVQMMLDDGAPVAALRMGNTGSLVGQQGRAELLAVPPVPVPAIIDQTGAGNSYCGGFLVGWLEQGGDLVAATCYAAVAASFALEVTGVAVPLENGGARRDTRYHQLREILTSPPTVKPDSAAHDDWID